jgi:hypothetical protein
MNSTITVDADPESARWLGIIYAVYGIIGIPANLLVMLLTIIDENVRAVPINVCIFSIAIGDMMVLVTDLSVTYYGFTFDETICKVAGVGVYTFIIMSMTLPACLAMCRYANVSSQQNLGYGNDF